MGLSDTSMFICSLSYLYSLAVSENRLESATTKLCNVTTHLCLRIRRQSTEGSSCQSGNFHHGTATISTPVCVDVASSKNLMEKNKIQWPIISYHHVLTMAWNVANPTRFQTAPFLDLFHIEVKMAVRLHRMGQVESSNIAHPKKMPRKSDESRGKFNLFNLFGHSHRLDKSVRIAAPRGHSFPLLSANALARLQKGSESTVQGVDLRSDLKHIWLFKLKSDLDAKNHEILHLIWTIKINSTVRGWKRDIEPSRPLPLLAWPEAWRFPKCHFYWAILQ